MSDISEFIEKSKSEIAVKKQKPSTKKSVDKKRTVKVGMTEDRLNVLITQLIEKLNDYTKSEDFTIDDRIRQTMVSSFLDCFPNLGVLLKWIWVPILIIWLSPLLYNHLDKIPNIFKIGISQIKNKFFGGVKSEEINENNKEDI